MASTYTDDHGIELPTAGEQDGTWGGTLNNDIKQLIQGITGYAEVTLAAVGTSGAPNEVKITNTSARSELSDGRNAYIEFVDGGDLGGTAYVQFTPATSKHLAFIKNSLSGSRSILLFQGTYDAARDFELTNGSTAIVFFDGTGASTATLVDLSAGFGGASAAAIVDGDFSANGLMTRTASGTYTSRTLTAGNGVAVTNGNGVSGNPTVAASYTLSTSAPSGDPGVTGHIWYRYTA